MAADRRSAVQEIAEKVESLSQSPLYDFRKANNYKPVIGEGNLEARILFIGEAPGAMEAKSGRPFVGASGRFLDELLSSIGLDREDVYITNVVKDRPPENRDPTSEEIALYSPFLEEQIAIIQPRVIVTLGRFSMDFILGLFRMPEQGQKISALHGMLLDAKAPYGPVKVLPLFHPAVALYTQNQRQVLLDDFQKLKPFIK